MEPWIRSVKNTHFSDVHLQICGGTRWIFAEVQAAETGGLRISAILHWSCSFWAAVSCAGDLEIVHHPVLVILGCKLWIGPVTDKDSRKGQQHESLASLESE
jgi:hypothetical protein